MVRVRSFGCSFTAGDELETHPERIFGGSLHAWPAIIARRLSGSYKCFAQAGRGNLWILNQLLANCKKDSLHIINWTWIDRLDYLNDQWQTIRPQGTDPKIAEFYYKNLHSQETDLLNSLCYIVTALDFLHTHNYSFVMTAIDPLILHDQMNESAVIKKLRINIRSFLADFDGMTFLEYSKKHQFPISDNLHPLHQAHDAAADIILARINTAIIQESKNEFSI